MGRVGTQAVISQDKVTFNLVRNGLLFQANPCNSRLRGSYWFPRQRWPLLVVLIGTLVAAGGPGLGIGLNPSRSAPRGFYRIVANAPTRGALVVACLPGAVAAFGQAQGYLGTGDCAGGTQPVLKTAGALGGDVVELRHDGVMVNGIPLLARRIETRDSAGRPLSHIDFGAYRVGAEEIWLFGLSHQQSWDSRYFGPVPLAGVRSVVRPLLTMDRGSHP